MSTANKYLAQNLLDIWFCYYTLFIKIVAKNNQEMK